ncbi:MAG TPA: type II toxin-antitoxin system mRNA interferase toxin, RelE/StbE family [Candidatus Pacearchaeota archaeon]|nr:type II toxin-antitoxin system mRNA interferase toxin, RelE/StbE family [Candidatus Pacearchaeota archaeon]HQM24463.1 type II toxin-antitoxin system mRNA interferase toxin, RelE/StbE family [Candidatus Pacearchaeota archaeon]
MIKNNILYSNSFKQRFLKLTKNIADIAIEKEKIFRENPFHPSLRLHELKGNLNGLWSISVNLKYRIIFKYMKNGDILFISIGKHDIYRDL